MLNKECLKDYIIFRDGCYLDDSGAPIATPEPTSGFYIETLEGMSIENIASTTGETKISAVRSLTENMYFAAGIVEKRIHAILTHRGLNLNKQGKLSNPCLVQTMSAPAENKHKGVRLTSRFICSSQSRIFIEKVKIKSTATINTTLYIKNAFGVVLFSMPIALIAGFELNFYVGKAFKEQTVLVVVDSVNTGLFEYACKEGQGCCGAVVKSSCKEFIVQGWDGVSVSLNAFLGVCARIDCTDEDLICSFLDKLGFAILYQTGVQLLQEWISPNGRLNLTKTHGEQWAMAKIQEWETKSVEYLDAEILNIENKLIQDKYCYECNNRFTMSTMLPS